MRQVRNVHAVDADGDLVCELTPWKVQQLPGTWMRVHPLRRCTACHLIVGGHGAEFPATVALLLETGPVT